MAVTALTPPTVRVECERVMIDGFIESDPSVVAAVSAGADPEEAVHQILHLGSRLASLATGAGSLHELESRTGARLEALTASTSEAIVTGLSALSTSATKLFGAKDSELAAALTTFVADVDRHLGDAFNPDDKRSIIALIEQAMTSLLESYGKRWAASTDPDVPGSPAARLVGQVRESHAEIKTELSALTLAVGAAAGRAEENERTAVKGLEFEPLVLAALQAIAAPHGDAVEHVGKATGAKGTMKGDMLVTLCSDDTGETARYVVEAKTKRLTLGATWRELDAATSNWEANAAVAVFASGSQAPTELPFWHSADRAIVVLDRDDPDPSALALARLFARWVARRRAVAAGARAADPERIAEHIDRIARALGRVSTIRRNLSTSTKSNADARAQVDALDADVRDALADLTREIGR